MVWLDCRAWDCHPLIPGPSPPRGAKGDQEAEVELGVCDCHPLIPGHSPPKGANGDQVVEVGIGVCDCHPLIPGSSPPKGRRGTRRWRWNLGPGQTPSTWVTVLVKNWPDWGGWIVGVEGLVVGRESRAVARPLLKVESILIHV
jgi:hypothetical protein